MTYVPEGEGWTPGGGFIGTALVQSWFGGPMQYVRFYDGIPLRDGRHPNDQINKLMGWTTVCYSTTVYAYVNDILNTIYTKTTCVTVPSSDPGEWQVPAPPEDGGGGSATNPIEDVEITTHIDTTMSDDFYEDDRLRCIMEKLMSNGFFKNTLNKFIGENKPINLNFNLDHYKAMAWQGLEGTDVYQNKSQAEKNAINAKKAQVLLGRNNTSCNDHGN